MVHCPERALLTVLDERGPTRVTALATELETHPITITQYCDDLRSDGYVYRVSADVYAISEAGRERLASLAE